MKRIADNLRITRREIQQAVALKDPEPIRRVAAACAAAGAHAIDINAGPLTKNPEADMTFFVDTVQSVTDLPLVLDTTNPRAMAAGLAAAKNRTLINGISLEPLKLEQILPLALTYPAEVVGFLLPADSRVPRHSDERFAIALELVEVVTAAGVARERLILDPVVPPLSWDDGLDRARGIAETIRLLPEVVGFGVKTMAGLSNLTTGAKDRSRKTVMESVYLSMLAEAGLDYLLMDVLNPVTLAMAGAADLLSAGEIFSWAQVEPLDRKLF